MDKDYLIEKTLLNHCNGESLRGLSMFLNDNTFMEKISQLLGCNLRVTNLSFHDGTLQRQFTGLGGFNSWRLVGKKKLNGQDLNFRLSHSMTVPSTNPNLNIKFIIYIGDTVYPDGNSVINYTGCYGFALSYNALSLTVPVLRDISVLRGTASPEVIWTGTETGAMNVACESDVINVFNDSRSFVQRFSMQEFTRISGDRYFAVHIDDGNTGQFTSTLE